MQHISRLQKLGTKFEENKNVLVFGKKESLPDYKALGHKSSNLIIQPLEVEEKYGIT